MSEPEDAPKPMDEAALIAAIDDSDNRSYGSNLSNLTAALSAERALSIDLFLGKNVDPAPEGHSQVVDLTVFETVQWTIPSLCRIFANGEDIVSIDPDNPQDVPQSEQEAAYLNWLVTQKNDWFSILQEWATDGLLTKNAYLLVYRDRSRQVQIETYENQTKEGLALLIADPNVQIIDAQRHPAPDLPPEPVLDPATNQPIIDGATGQPMTTPAMLYTVAIRRRQEQDDLCLRVLAPERVKVDQRAFSWRLDDRCNYFEYWEETTLTEIRNQGFDIPDDIADDPEIYTQEDYARDQFGERRLERYKPSDPSMRRVKARMIWIRVDYNGDGVAELLQILRIGRKIFYQEEVSRIPVASWVPFPLPHRHVGFSLSDVTMDIQRIKTTILRQGLNNLYLANNPQKVLNEQAVNLEDALVSRPGGVIRASDIDQIRYEDAPFVFPQAVEGLQYMDQVRASRTGVNNNFGGIDTKDLTNVQPGTVNQISTMAGQRVEMMARILAFAIEDLFAIVHEQVLKLGHKRQVVQLRGNWVEVDPGSWKKRNKFRISVAFGAGNRDAQMMRLMAIANLQSQALEMKIPVCTPENYYNTLLEMTKTSDLGAPQRFWTDPSTLPPPPPSPPPEIIKQQLINQSQEKVKAAELSQAEVESQRKAQGEKYAIDSNVGLQLLKAQQDHEHEVTLQTIKAHHDAALTAMEQQFKSATQQVEDTHTKITQAHSSIGQVASMADNVALFNEGVNKAVQIATGKRVVRKDKKGQIQGVDILDHEGKVIHSKTAIRGPDGRVTGLS